MYEQLSNLSIVIVNLRAHLIGRWWWLTIWMSVLLRYNWCLFLRCMPPYIPQNSSFSHNNSLLHINIFMKVAHQHSLLAFFFIFTTSFVPILPKSVSPEQYTIFHFIAYVVNTVNLRCFFLEGWGGGKGGGISCTLKMVKRWIFLKNKFVTIFLLANFARVMKVQILHTFIYASYFSFIYLIGFSVSIVFPHHFYAFMHKSTFKDAL